MLDAGAVGVSLELKDIGFTAGVNKAIGSVNKLGGELGQTEKKTQSAGTALSGMAKKVSAVFATLGAGQALKSIISLGATMEQTMISFEVMTGSKAKAESLISTLIKFADITPFTTEQMIQAGKAMTGYGFAADELVPILTDLGNISSGTGKDINELVQIFGKAKIEGRIMGDELMQLGNAGIPIFAHLAKALGTSEYNVRKLGEQGAITFPIFEKAIRGLGNSPLYSGLMDKQSRTLIGLWSTLTSKIAGMFTTLGGGIGELIKPILQKLIDLVDWMRELPGRIKKWWESLPLAGKELIIFLGILAATIGTVVLSITVIGPALIALKGLILTTIIPAIAQAFTWLAATIGTQMAVATAGISLVIAALIALGIGVYTQRDYIFGAISPVKNLLADIKSSAESLMETFFNIADFIIENFEKIKISINEVLLPIISTVKEFINSISSDTGSWLTRIKSYVSDLISAFNPIIDIVKSIKNTIIGLIEPLLQPLKDVFGPIVQAARDAISKLTGAHTQISLLGAALYGLTLPIRAAMAMFRVMAAAIGGAAVTAKAFGVVALLGAEEFAAKTAKTAAELNRALAARINNWGKYKELTESIQEYEIKLFGKVLTDRVAMTTKIINMENAAIAQGSIGLSGQLNKAKDDLKKGAKDWGKALSEAISKEGKKATDDLAAIARDKPALQNAMNELVKPPDKKKINVQFEKWFEEVKNIFNDFRMDLSSFTSGWMRSIATHGIPGLIITIPISLSGKLNREKWEEIFLEEEQRLKKEATSLGMDVVSYVADGLAKKKDDVKAGISALMKGVSDIISQGMDLAVKNLQFALMRIQEKIKFFSFVSDLFTKMFEKAAAKELEIFTNTEEEKFKTFKAAEDARLEIIRENILKKKALLDDELAAELERIEAQKQAAIDAARIDFELKLANLQNEAVNYDQWLLAKAVMEEDWRKLVEKINQDYDAKKDEARTASDEREKDLTDQKIMDYDGVMRTQEEIKKASDERIKVQEDAKNKAIEAKKLESEKKKADLDKKVAIFKYGLELQAFNADKHMKIMQARMDLARGIMAAAVAGAQIATIPIVGLVLGPAMFGILTAMQYAAYGMSTAMIASSLPPMPPAEIFLAKGGALTGPSHANGGVMANLEGGELVVDRERTSRFYNFIDRMTGGGAVFQPGAIQLTVNGNYDERHTETLADIISAKLARRTERYAY